MNTAEASPQPVQEGRHVSCSQVRLESNVFKTALIFEGGGMRAAYTSPVAVELLAQGIYFNQVYGVSAGSSLAVNYVSRDIVRTMRSFTDFVRMRDVGNWKTLLAHKGIFNAHHIYQEMGLPNGDLPFDMDTFTANPAQVTIPAIERDTGAYRYFAKADMRSLDDLMLRVRASSTLPVLMPPPVVDGRACYDGAFADGGGLPVQKALDDGHEFLFVVRTRPRGYRKTGTNSWAKRFFWRYPHMADAVLSRNARYNASCELLERLEDAGRAYVFYSESITAEGNERSFDALCSNYEAGYAQIRAEWGSLAHFLDRVE